MWRVLVRSTHHQSPHMDDMPDNETVMTKVWYGVRLVRLAGKDQENLQGNEGKSEDCMDTSHHFLVTFATFLQLRTVGLYAPAWCSSGDGSRLLTSDLDRWNGHRCLFRTRVRCPRKLEQKISTMRRLLDLWMYSAGT